MLIDLCVGCWCCVLFGLNCLVRMLVFYVVGRVVVVDEVVWFELVIVYNGSVVDLCGGFLYYLCVVFIYFFWIVFVCLFVVVYFFVYLWCYGVFCSFFLLVVVVLV